MCSPKILDDNTDSRTAELLLSRVGMEAVGACVCHIHWQNVSSPHVHIACTNVTCTCVASCAEKVPSQNSSRNSYSPMHNSSNIYRHVPSSTTDGMSSSFSFLSVVSNLERHTQKQQVKQARYHDNSKPLQVFSVRDPKDFSSTDITWVAGTIIKVTGPLSYHVQIV